MDRMLKWLPYVVIAVGLVIRLKILIQNRSLFIDEASLARNLCERSYSGFFTNLSYEQYAPPLFMVECKLVTQIFGNLEWAMRLIPFVAGLGSMWLLWLLLRDWIGSPVVRIYGLSLFCFSFFAIRYGTEFKQYSGDAFLALAFTWLAWRDKDAEWERRKTLEWVGLGCMGIWYSMPLVFTLSGVGLFFLWQRKQLVCQRVFFAIATWLLSFGMYYFLILRRDIGTDYLENYFDLYFLDVFTFSSEAWTSNFKLITQLFRNITDKSVISIGFGILAFGSGVFQVLKRHRGLAILLLIPTGAFLLACVFHYYNMMGRLTLFIFPSMILVMCLGLDRLWSFKAVWSKVLLSLFILFGIGNKRGLDFLTEKMTFEEIRPCLEVLSAQAQEGDVIYVDHEAIPAFEFYREHYEQAYGLENQIVRGTWHTRPAEVIGSYPDQNCWLLYSHALDSEIKRNIDLINSDLIELRCSSERVALYFYTD